MLKFFGSLKMHKLSNGKLIILTGIVIAAVLASGASGYLFVSKAQVKSQSIVWGVDFSQMQAEYLGLDWKETYSAIIDGLGAKNIKLHTPWSWVQGKQDTYYFDDIDWQIKQAEEKQVKIIYVVGMKTGRWPECHIPYWAEGLSIDHQQEEVLKYIKETVLRYKDSRSIINWQVENEPFLKFGRCPSWYYKDEDFLKKEIDLIKSIDPSRQIIVSESGEQSTWVNAAKVGDIVGITMYRNAWSEFTDTFGLNTYAFLTPMAYFKKAEAIKQAFGKKIICVELQTEPWVKKGIVETPLEEQLKLMNLDLFKENIEYAEQTGFDKFYFWGAEWWYWLKVKHGHAEIWDEAKHLF